MGNIAYDKDVIAWAQEQAKLLRSGRFEALDIEHIAEEIEDVGKSEQRELASRMAVLLAHLLKWKYQPARRSKSWQYTLTTQRKEVAYLLNEAPSLRTKFNDEQWLDIVWSKAKSQAESETGLDIDTFQEVCPWLVEQVMNPEFFPD